MNNLQVRDTNKSRIVNYLYSNDSATKQGIAKALGLSMPTVSLILKDLEARGLVKKTGTLESSGGRKPVANSLAYDAKISCGVEITQNHIRFAIIDLGENVLGSRRVRESFHSEEPYFRMLAEQIELFLQESGADTSRLLGVGIAVPGLVNTKTNIIEYSPTLHVRNLPIDSLTRHIAHPVLVNNEANLAGLAEIWKMDEVESAVYLSINKGVGGAVIIDNKLYNGLNGRSGEFGHMTIVRDGLVCSCGKRGCLEAYCSTRMLTEPNFEDVDDFFKALELGDRYCRQKWEIYLDYLTTGINNIRTIFDSDVILGGEIDQYLQKYAERLSVKLSPLNSFGAQPDYLHFSRFGDKASTIGAALQLVDAFLND